MFVVHRFTGLLNFLTCIKWWCWSAL